MTFKQAQEKKIESIYASDMEGGIDKYVLVWETDAVWCRGDYWDNGGIEDLFDQSFTGPFFETLREACDYIENKN